VRNLLRSWVLPFVNPRQLASVFILPKFLLEFHAYRNRSREERVVLTDVYPCLADRLPHTPFDPHYFYQGAWLARRLSVTKPQFHVDVGSSVTMLSVLSAAVPIAFVDYRPLAANVLGLNSVAGNVTSLPFLDDSVGSLSSLHVIEHVGLGRYGDPLEPEGTRRAAGELERVLQPGGRLFLSVPVGRQRVCFNAHRVLKPHTIESYFPQLRLEAFSSVDDAGHFVENASFEATATLDYGCGLFEFVKASG